VGLLRIHFSTVRDTCVSQDCIILVDAQSGTGKIHEVCESLQSAI
jgi:hypothetical protein